MKIQEQPTPIMLLALQRARVPKLRAPQVDHQEVGPDPDPTLMVRKQGIGTITFDTTTGDTMVSGRRRMNGGVLFKVIDLDGNLSKSAVQALFSAQKAEDDAAAKVAGNAYGENYASVSKLDVSDEILDSRDDAKEFIRQNSRKWENVSAVKYRVDENFAEGEPGSRWLMGGFLAA